MFKWSYYPRSYERNICNCVKKPEKFRTSTGFEPVTSRYRCDALTNWAMKPLTLGAGHLWFVEIYGCRCIACNSFDSNIVCSIKMSWLSRAVARKKNYDWGNVHGEILFVGILWWVHFKGNTGITLYWNHAKMTEAIAGASVCLILATAPLSNKQTSKQTWKDTNYRTLKIQLSKFHV